MTKRFYPRVTGQFSAVVETDKGFQMNVLVTEISTEGLSVECNIQARDLLTPGGCFVRNDGKPVEFYIWVALPSLSGQREEISVQCQVAYSRRVSSIRGMIGGRYLDMDNSGIDVLAKYIESVLAENVKPASVAA